VEDRIKNSYQTFIYDFIKDVLVVCPKCSGQAIVKSDDFSFRNYADKTIRVVCTKCGYNRQLINKPTAAVYSSGDEYTAGRELKLGSPIDPFFHLPVWLKEPMGSNLLWAYNYEHLGFLRNYVEAKIRERNGQEYFNKSLGSRLPKWLTSKNNRQEVLKIIDKLQTIK
jgi:DNA-directed RNA polymerase subunit RPC12/RpoP